MKAEIHPAYEATNVTCSCGAAFVTRSTVSSGAIHVDVCSVCHPFYTGKQLKCSGETFGNFFSHLPTCLSSFNSFISLYFSFSFLILNSNNSNEKTAPNLANGEMSTAV